MRRHFKLFLNSFKKFTKLPFCPNMAKINTYSVKKDNCYRKNLHFGDAGGSHCIEDRNHINNKPQLLVRQIGVQENVTQGRNQQGSKVRVQGQPNRHQEEAHRQGPGEG